VFLIALNVFLLIVGCLMDVYTAIIVFVPMLIPLGLQFGVNPVHLGVIFLANLAIGYSTPPVGMNLFIAAIRFDRPLLKLAVASLPFLALLLVVLLLITYVPALSLVLLH
jgi:C4-dicarboxylate transporter DctM subunit